MQIIKTPTGTIKVDETTKKLTQAEYNALGDNKKRRHLFNNRQ